MKKKRISKILSAFSITILATLLVTFTCAVFFDKDILNNLVSILRNGYIVNKDSAKEQFWPDNLNDEKSNVSTVDFLILNENEILNRYNAATIKAEVTDFTKNSERVYAWYEIDPNDNSKYNMFVASKNTIYLPDKSNCMFKNFTNLVRLNFNDAINTKYVTHMAQMFLGDKKLEEINGIENFDTSNVEYMDWMFQDCEKLTSLDLSKWDTSSLNSLMYGLFSGCTNLKELNVSTWDVSKVETFDSLFHGTASLTSVGVENWDMSSAKSLFHMFSNSGIVSLDLSNWNVSNVVNMDSTFREMLSLETINLSGWDTRKVTNMFGMFLGDTKLTQLDVTSFKTPLVTDFRFMFQNMTNLQELKASNMTIESALLMEGIFQNQSSIKKIDISSMDFVNSNDSLGYNYLFVNSNPSTDVEILTKNCNNVDWLLDKQSLGLLPATWPHVNLKTKNGNSCPLSKAYSQNLNKTSISTIEAKVRTIKYEKMDKSKIDEELKIATEKNLWHDDITDPQQTGATVYAYATISAIDPSLYDIHIVSEAEGIYLPPDSVDTFRSFANNLVEVDFGTARTDLVIYFANMFLGCSKLETIKGIENFDTSNAESFSYMFQKCSKLETLDLSKWDTSKITYDMNGIFDGCANLKELNVSTWDVSNVKFFDSLFLGASSLKTLDLSNWNVSNAMNMNSAFREMKSLETLDLSGWDTSKLTHMYGMFLDDINLQEIKGIENFDTSNVVSMSWLFQNCAKLTSLNLSKWNTSNVYLDMYGIFSGCTNLKELNVSTWDVSKVKIFDFLFYNTASLTSIGVENWNMSNAENINNMFAKSGIISLDLSKWDTRKVTNMNSTFGEMKSLESLNLNGWNTEKVTDMYAMFLWDTKLKQLDLTSFKTPLVTDFRFMFQHMESLEELKVPNMTIEAASLMTGMFQFQPLIKTIDISSMDFINANSTVDYTNLFQFTNDHTIVKVSSCQTADWILNHLTRIEDFPDTWKSSNFEFSGECPVKSYNVAKMDITSSDLLSFTDKSQISEASVKITNKDNIVVDNIYAKIKLQGTSSLGYDKKNYTITFYADKNYVRKQDVIVNSEWGGQNKYCLKANWIDSTQARNIVTARLASEIQAKYGLFPDAPNNGLIDGFFVELYVNGEYLGLYTMNIPKDEWMFGMDSDNENHIVFAAENPNRRSATTFEALAEAEDGKDFSIEAGPNDTPEEVASSFAKLNRLIAFVKDSTNEEFKQHINEYMNLDALLNYYIMMFISGGVDNMSKNMLLVTYDGKIWYPSLYDLDSTWGIYPDGTNIYGPNLHPTQYYGGTSLLFKKLVDNFPQEVQARYKEIRKIMTNDHIISEFTSFINTATPEMWEREHTKWSNIPGLAYTLEDQIRLYVAEHLKYVDSVMDQLYIPPKTYSDSRIKFDLEKQYVGEKYKFKDTGVNIYEDESINYTIFAQYKSSGINDHQVIFSNRNNNNAGIKIQSDYENVDAYQRFSLGPIRNNINDYYFALYKDGQASKEYRNIILVKQGDTYTAYLDSIDHTNTITNPMGTEKVETNLIIGADYHKDDFLAEYYSGETTSDYYTGVINKFTIYEGILSDEEIKSLLES